MTVSETLGRPSQTFHFNLFDIDNDGDLDFFYSTTSTIITMINTAGPGSVPVFSSNVPVRLRRDRGEGEGERGKARASDRQHETARPRARARTRERERETQLTEILIARTGLDRLRHETRPDLGHLTYLL